MFILPGDRAGRKRPVIDMLSVLAAGEVSVAAATTLSQSAFGRLHACSGATAYTITLPAVAGNTGKFIGFRFDTTSDALVTLDGSGSETIAGWTTIKYGANEWCILYCDGDEWYIASEYWHQAGFSAYKSVDQAVATGNVKITFDTEEWDSHAWFASSTFTPKLSGKYLFTGTVSYDDIDDGSTFGFLWYKNGAAWKQGQFIGSSVANLAPVVAGAIEIDMNGSSDYVEMYSYHDDAVGTVNVRGAQVRTTIQAMRTSPRA